MIHISILTSQSIQKLDRCVRSLESQTNKEFTYSIIVNSLDQKYQEEVSKKYPEAIITESNGTPGKGKNSVVSHWRTLDYSHYSMIDGDDFVLPYFVEQLYIHIEKQPDLDVLGFPYNSEIHKEGRVEVWETNSPPDPRSSEEQSPVYLNQVNNQILAHDRLLLFSKSCLDFVLFYETIKVYEDAVLSLKLLCLHRRGELKYYFTDCVEGYVYDMTNDSSICSTNSDWIENFNQVGNLWWYVCHPTFSSTKYLPLINCEMLSTPEERKDFIENNIVYPLYCFSYGTDITKTQLLASSADRYGYSLSIEGIGEDYSGHGQKLNALRRFCLERQEEDLVLFMDAYDTVFIRPYAEFIEECKNFDLENKVLFNAEKNCWPDGELAPWYHNKYPSTPYKFLNSGLILGKAKNILSLLPQEVPVHFDDQRYYMAQQVLHGNETIDLDFETRLFNPLSYSIKKMGFDGDHIYNLDTLNKPFVLHANFTEYVTETLSTLYSMGTLIEVPTKDFQAVTGEPRFK